MPPLTPLDFAVAELNAGSAEVPKGSNRGPRVDLYTGGRAEPWCGHFVAWCHHEAGIVIPGYVKPSPTVASPLAGVQFLEDTFKKHGWWWPVGDMKLGVPSAGDLVFLNRRGQSDKGPGRHVGIVERVDGPYVVSIDGNWGDRVARVRRVMISPLISGFGRMK